MPEFSASDSCDREFLKRAWGGLCHAALYSTSSTIVGGSSLHACDLASQSACLAPERQAGACFSFMACLLQPCACCLAGRQYVEGFSVASSCEIRCSHASCLLACCQQTGKFKPPAWVSAWVLLGAQSRSMCGQLSISRLLLLCPAPHAYMHCGAAQVMKSYRKSSRWMRACKFVSTKQPLADYGCGRAASWGDMHQVHPCLETLR